MANYRKKNRVNTYRHFMIIQLNLLSSTPRYVMSLMCFTRQSVTQNVFSIEPIKIVQSDPSNQTSRPSRTSRSRPPARRSDLFLVRLTSTASSSLTSRISWNLLWLSRAKRNSSSGPDTISEPSKDSKNLLLQLRSWLTSTQTS